MFERLFCFAKKSRWYYFPQQTYKQNIQVFQTFFILNTMGCNTHIFFFHREYERNHQNNLIGICSYRFGRALPSVSFEKKPRFYHLSVQRYSQNKLGYKDFETAGLTAY
jgi:hypothetical protein